MVEEHYAGMIMDRLKQLLYATLAAVLIVALIACALNYLALQSATEELEYYKQQQREISRAIMTDYLPDMQAAKMAWVEAHQDEYRDLGQEGITIEADYLTTPYYSAVIDPADPYRMIIGPPGDVEAGKVKIGLGQYYAGNYTRASGWSVTYVVDRSTHSVAGFTATLVQNVAYQHYMENVLPGIHDQLGVAEGSVTGDSPVTLDTSYMADRNTWIDVTEHKYRLKNTDVTPYLLIKTYVDADTEQVTGVDISRPYYTSQARIMR
ncbi:hypothetical protein [Methanocella arvoryzae]|uniref:Uncharacterized protein n=1 Tax=Methanocella arvoryzae (strain DSM 22066 / NBRC 105507 / MRE50) TaxID=351160 RepID=Q0W4Z5_METAR|nr:hypothetical protein [Methanocella arvoryzae]CAJ36548.1 hypothetical protein RCIX1247 [Methanocella arvoryzae MRE50]